MKFEIITIFPEMFFAGPLQYSIIKRAVDAKIININAVNLRDFSCDKHLKVDDSPYGGGAGMVMKPAPFFRAVDFLKSEKKLKNYKVILFTPIGTNLTQEKVKELATYETLVLLCGHYEGIDERVAENLADECISIGDYVLTGGELPAMVLIDAVARMLPGVLGDFQSAQTDSFYNGLLAYPQYTKPSLYENLQVPAVLLSGHHKNIEAWRQKQSLERTQRLRPDLFEKYIKKDEK